MVPAKGHRHRYGAPSGPRVILSRAEDLIEIPAVQLVQYTFCLSAPASPVRLLSSVRDEASRVGIATYSLGRTAASSRRSHPPRVLSVGCRINSCSEGEESVLFERVRIGRHARLRKCIVDKDVEIPAGAEIGYNPEHDRQRGFTVEGGITTIPKRAKLDGTVT